MIEKLEKLATRRNAILLAAFLIVVYITAGGDPQNVEKGFEAIDKTNQMYDRLDSTVNDLDQRYAESASEVTE